MTRVFNTRFELSLRALVLLYVSDKPIDLEVAYVADFVATYAKAFSIADSNINGDNQFMFSEFAVRRSIMKDALKELVLKGYAQPSVTGDGIAFEVTDKGAELFNTLQSGYASAYAGCARSALVYISGHSLKNVIDDINRLTRQPVGGGA